MRFLFILSALFVFAACQNATQSAHVFDMPEQILTFEGPLSEGPNSANVTMSKSDLNKLAQKAGFDLSKARDIKIESVVVHVDSTAGALLSNYALQAVAGKRDLISVALAQGGSTGDIALTPSQEVNITPYFTGNDDLTWVLDANATRTDTATYQVKLKMRLNVTAPALQ